MVSVILFDFLQVSLFGLNSRRLYEVVRSVLLHSVWLLVGIKLGLVFAREWLDWVGLVEANGDLLDVSFEHFSVLGLF